MILKLQLFLSNSTRKIRNRITPPKIKIIRFLDIDLLVARKWRLFFVVILMRNLINKDSEERFWRHDTQPTISKQVGAKTAKSKKYFTFSIYIHRTCTYEGDTAVIIVPSTRRVAVWTSGSFAVRCEFRHGFRLARSSSPPPPQKYLGHHNNNTTTPL